LTGVGDGGGKIAECYKDLLGQVVGSLIINTDELDFKNLSRVIGERNWERIGEARLRGSGTGGRWPLGSAAALESRDEIVNAAKDEKRRNRLADANLLLFTLSLGGGTGSGATPPVVEFFREELRRSTVGLKEKQPRQQIPSQAAPVTERPLEKREGPRENAKFKVSTLVVGTFPWREEMVQQFAAVAALSRFLDVADGVILADNDKILKGSLGELPEANMTIARATELMFYSSREDASGMFSTLDSTDLQTYCKVAGKAGFCVPCHAMSDEDIDSTTLLREAVTKGAMVQCDYKSAFKAIMVLAGDPDEITLEEARAAVRDLGQDIPIIRPVIVRSDRARREAFVLLNSPDMPKLKETLDLAHDYVMLDSESLASEEWGRLTKQQIDDLFSKLQSQLQVIESLRKRFSASKKP
jgi:cell division GTPase FtsZ